MYVDYPSEYDKVFEDGVALFVFSLVLEVYAVLTLALCLYKISGYILYRGFTATVPIVILVMEIIGNVSTYRYVVHNT